jgi:hypothetical protein
MDIVERLRKSGHWEWEIENICEEAATEIERLRKRVELIEGYLRGALNVVEGFVHCDTKEARQALGEEK